MHRRALEHPDGRGRGQRRPAGQHEQAEGGAGGTATDAPDVVQAGAAVAEHPVAQQRQGVRGGQDPGDGGEPAGQRGDREQRPGQEPGVARALALHPKLIIADEPVSALDVSIRAQVINLLDDLQDELHLTYIFIAHDLGVVRHVSDRIAVMYLGKIVEVSPAEELYQRPVHPYTEAQLSAVPIPDPDLSDRRAQIVLEGDILAQAEQL
jgi:ABC-type protease/lipase transport system fused ATPase/permease subunit